MTNLFGREGQPNPDQDVDVDPMEYVLSKFKKDDGSLDVEALAKAKLESDKHIKRVETEQSRLREDLNTRVNMQDFLDQIKEATKTRSESDHTREDDQVVTDKSLSDEDLQAKVDAILNKKQLESEAQRNEAFVVQELTKLHGTNYEAKVLARAKELGVDRTWLLDMARRTPKAFLELVGAPAPKTDPNIVTPPRGTVTPPSPLSSGTKNKAYYDKLRQTNPTLYWSAKVQMEEYQNALKMGESFHN